MMEGTVVIVIVISDFNIKELVMEPKLDLPEKK